MVYGKSTVSRTTSKTDNISFGMLKLGVKPGYNIGIVGSNRPEWNMLDMAIMQIGAVPILFILLSARKITGIF